MLYRPFYGIILGAFAFGFFPHHINLSRKFSFFRTSDTAFRFYGFCWKRKFFGKSVRVGWTLKEIYDALTEMALRDEKYKIPLLKLDVSKSCFIVDSDVKKPDLLDWRAPVNGAYLTKDEYDAVVSYLVGKLVLPEPTPPKKGLVHVPTKPYQPDPDRRNKSKAREQLIYAEIEHELRNPRMQKLFDLVCERYGRDVCLKWWRHDPTKAAWEATFEDQLPKPESIKVSGAGELPPKPSQAEVAREMMKQFQEKEYLCDQQALHGKDV